MQFGQSGLKTGMMDLGSVSPSRISFFIQEYWLIALQVHGTHSAKG